MKKILTVLAIALFTINAGAQEAKPATKEKEEKKCCAKKDSHAKMMTDEEITKCKAKCKAEGKVCKADDMSKCKKDNKKCSAEEMSKSKADGKKCCAKKE